LVSFWQAVDIRKCNFDQEKYVIAVGNELSATGDSKITTEFLSALIFVPIKKKM
jgi:hypothetical protein